MTKKHTISQDRLSELNGFLIGSKLGDGAFIQRTKNHNTYITYKHADNQYDYLVWKRNYLRDIVSNEIKERNFTEGRNSTWKRQFYFSTISLKELTKYKLFSITELIDELDEMALSIWVLDDGNVYDNQIKISCGRFTNEEKIYATKIIKDRFNIHCGVYEHPRNSRKGYIRLNTEESRKVRNIILKTIPNELDIIKYKFFK